MTTNAEALSQPRAEKTVNELSSCLSRLGSGLCSASSRSGSRVSHKYCGMVDVLAAGGADARLLFGGIIEVVDVGVCMLYRDGL